MTEEESKAAEVDLRNQIITLQNELSNRMDDLARYEAQDELSKQRIAELESATDRAIRMLAQTDCCPDSMENTGCLGPVDGNCENCWAKWLFAGEGQKEAQP